MTKKQYSDEDCAELFLKRTIAKLNNDIRSQIAVRNLEFQDAFILIGTNFAGSKNYFEDIYDSNGRKQPLYLRMDVDTLYDYNNYLGNIKESLEDGYSLDTSINYALSKLGRHSYTLNSFFSPSKVLDEDQIKRGYNFIKERCFSSHRNCVICNFKEVTDERQKFEEKKNKNRHLHKSSAQEQFIKDVQNGLPLPEFLADKAKAETPEQKIENEKTQITKIKMENIKKLLNNKNLPDFMKTEMLFDRFGEPVQFDAYHNRFVDIYGKKYEGIIYNVNRSQAFDTINLQKDEPQKQ